MRARRFAFGRQTNTLSAERTVTMVVPFHFTEQRGVVEFRLINHRVRIRRGDALCARCNKPILPTMVWELDHADGGGPADYLGASHRGCNRATVTHAKEAAASEPELCEHRRRGKIHGKKCCGCSRDW